MDTTGRARGSPHSPASLLVGPHNPLTVLTRFREAHSWDVLFCFRRPPLLGRTHNRPPTPRSLPRGLWPRAPLPRVAPWHCGAYIRRASVSSSRTQGNPRPFCPFRIALPRGGGVSASFLSEGMDPMDPTIGLEPRRHPWSLCGAVGANMRIPTTTGSGRWDGAKAPASVSASRTHRTKAVATHGGGVFSPREGPPPPLCSRSGLPAVRLDFSLRSVDGGRFPLQFILSV